MVGYDNREWWIDYAKTIGIFLVVFIHLIQVNFSDVFGKDKSLLLFGTVFFMPLFFFVSGYLYKDIKPKTALKKYFKRLVIPYIFFTLVGIVVFIIHNNLHDNYYTILSTTGKFILTMILVGPYSTMNVANGTIWFLIALFNIIIIFSLLKKYFKDDKAILLIIIGFNVFLYVLTMLKLDLRYFAIDSALLGIMFFFAGYLSKKHNLMKYFKNNYINIVLSVVFFAMAYLEYIYNGALGLRSASWSGNFILSYIGAFSGILMVVSLSSVLAKFKNKIIYLISINTLTIMGLEQYLRMYISPLFKMPGIKEYPLFNAFAIAILVILISVLMALFLNKYAPVLIGNRGKSKAGMFQRLYLMIKNRRKNHLDS